MTDSAEQSNRCQRCGGIIPPDSALPVCSACALEDAIKPQPAPGVEPAPTTHMDEAAGKNAKGRLGPYELRTVIGRGGMGVVYRAWHPALNREVAVKILAGGAFASADARHRFEREAKVLARVQHPGLVTIHDVGQSDGVPWFSMSLVEGPSLADLTRDGPLEPERAAEILLAVAEALQAAHAVGVLHRDLKPSNILIGPDDRPRVTDFGLAWDAVDDRLLTQSGQTLGTPSYLAPEQVSSTRGGLGPATDVYGLGAVLYQLLTGRPPFAAAKAAETVQQVLTQEPISPRRLNPTVPHELAAICLRCLRKNPVRRYPFADVLAGELKQFLERVTKRRQRSWPVLAGTTRGRVLLTGAGIALLLVLVSVGLLTMVSLRQNQMLRVDLAGRVATLENVRRTAADARYAHQISAAQRALAVGDHQAARHLLQDTEKQHRGWDYEYLSALLAGAQVRLAGHSGPATSVAFSPRGQRLASVGSDLHLRVWDPTDRRQVQDKVAHRDTPTCLAFSPTGEFLFTGGKDGMVRRWAVDGWEPARQYLVESGEITSLDVAGEAPLVAAGDDLGRVHVWRDVDGEKLYSRQGDVRRINAVSLSDDGRWLAAGGPAGRILLWSAESGESTAFPSAHGGGVRDLDFSPDGLHLFSCGDDLLIRQWRVADGALVRTLHGHLAAVRCLSVSADGGRLASADLEGTIRIWDLPGGAATRILHGHEGRVLDVAFGLDSNELASVGAEGDVFLWRLDVPGARRVMLGHRTTVSALAHASQSPVLASGDWAGRICLWDTKRESLIRSLPGHDSRVSTLAVSPRGDLVVSGAADGACQVYRESGEATPVTYRADAGPVRCLGLSPDGEFAISGYDQGQVRLWDTRSGKQRRVAEFVPARVIGATILANGQEGLLLHVNGRIVRWNLNTGAEIEAVQMLEARLTAGNVAVETGRIAVGDATGGLAISSGPANCGSLLFRGHSGAIWDLALTADGGRLATTGGDRRVRIWDACSGLELLLLSDIAGTVRSLAWNDDCHTLIAGDQLGRVWLLGQTVKEARELAAPAVGTRSQE